MKPRGIRNKNPLNVKNIGARGWLGQVAADERGHAVFGEAAYGVRAAIRLLSTYWAKHNLRTVAEILSRWAPSSDTVGSIPGAPPNAPKEYEAYVAKAIGKRANTPLKLFRGRAVDDDKTLLALLAAMAAYELGMTAPAGWIEAGLALYQTQNLNLKAKAKAE